MIMMLFQHHSTHEFPQASMYRIVRTLEHHWTQQLLKFGNFKGFEPYALCCQFVSMWCHSEPHWNHQTTTSYIMKGRTTPKLFLLSFNISRKQLYYYTVLHFLFPPCRNPQAYWHHVYGFEFCNVVQDSTIYIVDLWHILIHKCNACLHACLLIVVEPNPTVTFINLINYRYNDTTYKLVMRHES